MNKRQDRILTIVLDSNDSRYFGFVPADFVVGIVPGK